MSAAFWIWLALVITAAAAIALTVIVAVQVLRRCERPFAKRVTMAVLAPGAAVQLYRGGRHGLPIAYAATLVAYVGLRIAIAAGSLA